MCYVNGMEPDKIASHDSQARVAQWVNDRTGLGAGDDPVGFLLSSYDLKISEMEALRTRIASLEELLAVSAKVCGNNNCNCPGSDRVKKAVRAHMEKFK